MWISFVLLCFRYFQGFLQSEFHCKHQIDILTGSQVHLADMLYNESALFYFMEVSQVYWKKSVNICSKIIEYNIWTVKIV